MTTCTIGSSRYKNPKLRKEERHLRAEGPLSIQGAKLSEGKLRGAHSQGRNITLPFKKACPQALSCLSALPICPCVLSYQSKYPTSIPFPCKPCTNVSCFSGSKGGRVEEEKKRGGIQGPPEAGGCQGLVTCMLEVSSHNAQLPRSSSATCRCSSTLPPLLKRVAPTRKPPLRSPL